MSAPTTKQPQCKIPRKLHAEILEKAGLAISSVDICEWLHEEHGVMCEVRQVQRLIQKHREEREEITSAIYAEEIANTALGDLAIVGDMIESLEEAYENNLDSNPAVANQFAKTLALYLDYRKSLLGHQKGRDPASGMDKDAIISGLLGKLGK
jgi:hypothetical protein